MAQPATTSFGKFLVELGDGAAQEAFTAPCGFTQKGFELTAATSEANVPDCDNPEAPSWVQRGVSSFSASVSGSGVMVLAASDVWRTWFLSGQAKNIRVHVNETAAAGGGHYDFPALLTSLGKSTQLGSDGNKVQQTVAIQSAGVVTWTAAAA